MKIAESLQELINVFKERKITHSLNLIIGILIIISFHLSGVEPDKFFQQLKNNELAVVTVIIISIIASLSLGLLFRDNYNIKYPIEFRNILKALIYKLSDILMVAASTIVGVYCVYVFGEFSFKEFLKITVLTGSAVFLMSLPAIMIDYLVYIVDEKYWSIR